MKIGKFVQRHIPAIFNHCQTVDPGEFRRLQDVDYARATFGINYPFCRAVATIPDGVRVRYWAQVHDVLGVPVRVCNHWLNPPASRALSRFQDYLAAKGIAQDAECPAQPLAAARIRGHAVGNAQNALIRNILSRLGEDDIDARHWEATLHDFGHACAYCGGKGALVTDHAVPINRHALGEHRRGNLVPACRRCNLAKGGRSFRDYLHRDPARIARIDAHMHRHGYVPLGGNEHIRRVLNLADQEIRCLSDGYVEVVEMILARERAG